MPRRKKNEKKWSEMTYEERRAELPEHLNKVGEWLLSGFEKKQYLIINDEKAILK
ncbi:MAG: hypothetical protein LUC26_01775 [Prevotella sp.]|nr:hypothetical protein [Prevotella sp.]MCD8288630.1 hypothetical protein [Prevotella sp.]